MNISQLESFSLTESAKFKNTLNPAVWDRHEHLKNAFKGQIRVGSDEYRQYLGLKETQIKDVVVAGANAGYLYEAGETVDVVFIADIDPDPTFRELFMEHNYKFNHLHSYEADGHKIQFFVHPSDTPFVSRGSYSVIHECWQQVAQRKPAEPQDTVALLRQAGYENSPRLEVVRKKKVIRERKPVVYGYGQDYISEVSITPDGTSPTTAQFTNEDDAMSEEDILKDFINFCASSLDLAELPQVKLRRDPQWSVVNKTFGRYNNAGRVLEVAWGQRHVMDVLRTVAHELTHALQHERESLPDTAGDTGSPFENEANARAGILMREYAQLHPEFFNHGLAESSGYIPTAAQAHDPRFEMALTADIRPGALGKNANKLLLNTDTQGHPQLMRTDGVVQRMMEEYRRFKS
jgi:hypothetical protein